MSIICGGLGRDYLGYYHNDRTHIGLNKGTPANRPIEQPSSTRAHRHRHRESVVFIIGTAGQKQRD
jgi:hypothetical protein